MDQDAFDLQIKHDFITEALEMLGWVEDQFLIFEQNPSDSKVVDEIFRMAHTVKGSAMTCGFTRLGEFAHVMETLLVRIREGVHSPDSETVDVLLRANDTLRTYLERLRSNFDAVLDTSSMEEDLMYFIGDDLKPASGAAPLSGFGFFDDEEETPPALAVVSQAPLSGASGQAISATPKPILTISFADYDNRAQSFEELNYLSLKAYLDLSTDSSPEGVKNCLKLLEEALAHLHIIRST